jgi:hypothetical protein
MFFVFSPASLPFPAFSLKWIIFFHFISTSSWWVLPSLYSSDSGWSGRHRKAVSWGMTWPDILISAPLVPYARVSPQAKFLGEELPRRRGTCI